MKIELFSTFCTSREPDDRSTEYKSLMRALVMWNWSTDPSSSAAARSSEISVPALKESKTNKITASLKI